MFNNVFLGLLVLTVVCLIDNCLTASCQTDTDCNHGKCLSNQTCLCDKGYVTFNSTSQNCNYEQKKKLTAFLLSFLVGLTGKIRTFFNVTRIDLLISCLNRS